VAHGLLQFAPQAGRYTGGLPLYPAGARAHS
jgi:hypothetical protein